MAYLTKDGETLETGKVDFGHRHIRSGVTEEDRNAGSFVRRESHSIFDSIVNGGEKMNKLYQAVILDKVTGVVTSESYVTASNKEQAFAKVDTGSHSLDNIKVFLNKIGEYKPK